MMHALIGTPKPPNFNMDSSLTKLYQFGGFGLSMLTHSHREKYAEAKSMPFGDDPFAAHARGAGECRRFNMYAFFWCFIFLAECGVSDR
jgi:hypothetical protein